jgi:hypothetical protein
MNNTLVQITAQSYENKAFYEGRDAWKPTGEQIFKLYADSDDFFYAEDKCIQAIKQLLKEQSNSAFKFMYVSHELIFHEPIELSTIDFENILTRGEMQFDRNRNGSLYDRGNSDSYYGRAREPHWYPDGTYQGERITELTNKEIEEYNKGYDENTEYKDYGEMAKGGKVKSRWIQEALSGNKGELRKTAKRKGLIKGDEKLSKTDLNKLQKMGGKTAKRARLAETLIEFKK